MELSLTYSDIAIVPTELSTINSRNEVDLKTRFLHKDFSLPILSAPMKTVTGPLMARKLLTMGCLPVLARSEDFDADLEAFQNSADIPGSAAVSIGATGDFLQRAAKFIQAGARIICIDTANGFHASVGHAVKQLQRSKEPIKIIAGNIGSVEGYEFMHKLGVNAVRVGIGNGSVCSTSIATGIGMGQVTLLWKIKEYKAKMSVLRPMPFPEIIADGGIKEPGDVCKALALGADTVMIGSLFAGTDETPGEKEYRILPSCPGGGMHKIYAGEASRATKGNTAKYVEGVSTHVLCKGPVTEVVQELEDGLRSSMAYMNCRTLEDFKRLPEKCFIQLSANARLERTPHLLSR